MPTGSVKVGRKLIDHLLRNSDGANRGDGLALALDKATFDLVDGGFNLQCALGKVDRPYSKTKDLCLTKAESTQPDGDPVVIRHGVGQLLDGLC